MKDILITKHRIKTELYVLLGCIVAMELLNAYAIVQKGGEWSELFFSLGYVCAAAVVLYVVLAVVRLLVGGVGRWLRKGKTGKGNAPRA